MEGYHRSVLLKEVIASLDIKAGRWYLDCTLGDGGHTLEILKHRGNVAGIDVDPEAIKRARERLGSLGYLARLPARQGNLVLIQGNFRDLKNLIQQTDFTESKFSGAVFDLGVSSLQLENPERGFSFLKEGLIDMRMDPSLGVTASDLLKVLSRKELCELFYNLGEEKYSGRLADAVVRAREVKEVTGDRGQGTGIRRTTDFAKIIERVVGDRRKGQIHPATKVFQALRIAVNDELGALKEGLDQVKEIIAENGRIVVISFHSLEDRIVKNTFKDWEHNKIGEVLTKKPIVPDFLETTENPRSRSAKMRVFKVTSC